MVVKFAQLKLLEFLLLLKLYENILAKYPRIKCI